MKRLLAPGHFLNKITAQVKSKIGGNAISVLGIMAILLVFCGLVIGLLGRGWLGAWSLVILGIILGFFPCLDFLITDMYGDSSEYDYLFSENIFDEEIKSEESVSAKQQIRDEASKEAIKFEAFKARQRLKQQEEDEKKKEELLQELERLRRIQLEREFIKQQDQKRAEEEQRRAKHREEEEKRKRAREEEKRRKQRAYNQGNVYRNNTRKKNAPVFFSDVKSLTELKAKYKELIKKYHPDNGNGDTEALQRVKAEYKELYTFFEKYDKHH